MRPRARPPACACAVHVKCTVCRVSTPRSSATCVCARRSPDPATTTCTRTVHALPAHAPHAPAPTPRLGLNRLRWQPVRRFVIPDHAVTSEQIALRLTSGWRWKLESMIRGHKPPFNLTFRLHSPVCTHPHGHVLHIRCPPTYKTFSRTSAPSSTALHPPARSCPARTRPPGASTSA